MSETKTIDKLKLNGVNYDIRDSKSQLEIEELQKEKFDKIGGSIYGDVYLDQHIWKHKLELKLDASTSYASGYPGKYSQDYIYISTELTSASIYSKYTADTLIEDISKLSLKYIPVEVTSRKYSDSYLAPESQLDEFDITSWINSDIQLNVNSHPTWHEKTIASLYSNELRLDLEIHTIAILTDEIEELDSDPIIRDLYIGDIRIGQTINEHINNLNNPHKISISQLEGLSGGQIPPEYLPSYVDDIISGYYDGENFYSTQDGEAEPVDGSAHKIYFDTETGKTYRWAGEQFIEIHSVEDLAEELLNSEDAVNVSTTTIDIVNSDVISINQETLEDKEDEIPTAKVIKNYVDSKIPSIEGLATKEYVDSKVKDVDLTEYATKEYVNDAIANIPQPEVGVDEETVKAIIADYLEENSSETDDLNIESVITESDNIPTSDAVINYVQNELSNLPSGGEVDLSNYYTKNEIDSSIQGIYDWTNSYMAEKADAWNVYTKTEVEQLIASAITTTLNEEV